MTDPHVTSEVTDIAPDGTITLKVTIRPAAAPAPGPPPAPAPVPTIVTIGSASHTLDAVNPTAANNPAGRPFPGCRGPNQLVAYRQPSLGSGANAYGWEASVGSEGLVRRAATIVAGIPPGGWILSGHGTAADWLRTTATVGAAVAFTSTPVPTPGPVTTDQTIAVYMLDGVGTITQVPPECNQLRVAFVQGTGLAEWGGDTPAQTAAAVTAWHAAVPGRRVLLSIGGEGGTVDMAVLPNTIRSIEAQLPVDGIDWDLEGGAINVPTVVAVSKALALGREDTWLTTFTPPGGPPVAQYLSAAGQCQQAGLRVQFSQQLYDSKIVQADVIRQTNLAVQVLGAESVLIGCMVGDDPARYSTAAQWEVYLRAVRAKWPGIGGAYLWESSRPGTGDWARRMAAVLA